jgi:hypothetical protein
LLRPEHGVAFEKVGLIANDMTIWHQTFIIPLSKIYIKLTCTTIRTEKRPTDTSEYTRFAAAIMNDYQNKNSGTTNYPVGPPKRISFVIKTL